jgi:putative transposase
MPSKNRVKQWAPEAIYHVYNRGNNKQAIYLDQHDYATFLNLMKRGLQQKVTADPFGRPNRNWHDDIELLAFCLMPNHFHLLLYQRSERAISDFMRGLSTSYVGYFNKRHHRVGHLFQDIFKASHIDEDAYWQHISRYIHLNPRAWRTWEWSSLPYYLHDKHADWVRPERVLDVFEGGDYLSFVEDYEGVAAMADELKYVTAD